MEQGDKTPKEEMLYSWRLIPIYNQWSRPASNRQVMYEELENGSYFFQVKVLDSKGNECVTPIEKFFEIRVIPFYKKSWFIWSTSGAGIVMAAFFSVIFTLRGTRKKLYEQRYNPYVVGEAVHEPEMFFGRETLMQDIFQSLKRNSICLTGERRIGKTTILEHLDKMAEKPLFSFFCNLESVKEELFFSRIMQHLINKIQAEIKEELLELVLFNKPRQNYDDSDFEDDIVSVLRFLKNHYDPGASIIMCLDEIDATQDFSDATHSSLRNVFQTYQGTIRLVAAGVAIKRSGWSLPTSPWYNFFEYKEVAALEKSFVEKLITEPVRGFYSFEKKAVDFIVEKTNGKPFYIQTICKKSIIRILDEKRNEVMEADVKRIYSDLIHLELNREFEAFWEELSKGLQDVIIQAASGSNLPLTKGQAEELLKNRYNHSHKAITLHEGKAKFSSIFLDWLNINYGYLKT